jgi:hypothetical protein
VEGDGDEGEGGVGVKKDEGMQDDLMSYDWLLVALVEDEGRD